LRRDGLAYCLADGNSSAAAGCDHSVFIDRDGQLLHYGGEGEWVDPTPRLFATVRDVRFQSVSCSNWVSMALSEDGDVYSWAQADNDPFAEDTEGGEDWAINGEPEIVQGLHTVSVRRIAAGSLHCAAATDDGALYTWSSWAHGFNTICLGYEIGFEGSGFADYTTMTLKRVRGALDGVRLRCVAAGFDTTFVASQEGELFSFGDGEWGTVGHGNKADALLPKRVEALSLTRGQVVKEVAAGYTCCMALTRDGEVCVLEDCERPRTLDALRDTRVMQISAVSHHMAAVDGGSGCLGHGGSGWQTVAEPTPVQALAATTRLTVSAEDCQTLAVAEHGMVYAFGFRLGGRPGIPPHAPSDAHVGVSHQGRVSRPVQIPGLRLLA
jgi:hypothetical protein